MEVKVMAWKWAALMPHPPILVPEVGCGREREAEETANGLESLVGAIAGMGAPDAILLLSPHQPYALRALALNRAPSLRGSFAPFGAPQVSFDLAPAVDEIGAISSFLKGENFPVRFGESGDLTRDQGSTVPLYFLRRGLGKLPPGVLASQIGLDPARAFELGRALASFDDKRAWGLLASGDLSHRLKPGAPAGFSPAGRVFDDAIVASLRAADAASLLDMPASTREEAGECGLRSVLAMLGLVSASCGKSGAIDVLSYEGPFGVGYCSALWRGA
jgi:aromatic ring-opening dioxygenase LigB subunit